MLDNDMIAIPSGEYTIGLSDEQVETIAALDPRVDLKRSARCQPQRTVFLEGFLIAKQPVSVKEYAEYADRVGIPMPPAPPWGFHDDYPIVNVTWYDASGYCHWSGKRLPTEVEWEAAARGFTAQLFPWGNEWLDDAAHSDGLAEHSHKCRWSNEETSPVGSHPKGSSPFGVEDMVGNIWEWCADLREAEAILRGEAVPDYVGKGNFWVGTCDKATRGGRLLPDGVERTITTNGLSTLTCGARGNSPAALSDSYKGFRCVKDTHPTDEETSYSIRKAGTQ